MRGARQGPAGLTGGELKGLIDRAQNLRRLRIKSPVPKKRYDRGHERLPFPARATPPPSCGQRHFDDLNVLRRRFSHHAYPARQFSKSATAAPGVIAPKAGFLGCGEPGPPGPAGEISDPGLVEGCMIAATMNSSLHGRSRFSLSPHCSPRGDSRVHRVIRKIRLLSGVGSTCRNYGLRGYSPCHYADPRVLRVR